VPFRRFMEVALYHPEFGYYRQPRDPFGRGGDFYTAEQIQPAFGILMAQRVRQLFRAMGEPSEFTVVEPGAGRREMADAFAEWRYVSIDIEGGELPEAFAGVVFANEFFDALPVTAAVFEGGVFRELLVDFDGERFTWKTSPGVDARTEDYLRRYFPSPEEGMRYEVNLDALDWMKRIAERLTFGYVIAIDYGYTRRESVRFPAGTLMGYRRHAAHENVLEEPGERDITAHVNFTALEEAGAALGLRTEAFETLAQTILKAGEADQFAAVLACGAQLQLKTLLFGMGETFRVLVQKKEKSG